MAGNGCAKGSLMQREYSRGELRAAGQRLAAVYSHGSTPCRVLLLISDKPWEHHPLTPWDTPESIKRLTRTFLGKKMCLRACCL